MKDSGYINLWGIECIFVTEDDRISIIPESKEDIRRLNEHFDDHNFVLSYSGRIGGQCTAFVERVSMELGNSISLFPIYIFERNHGTAFSGFEIMGEAIDDFFSPSRYFYDRKKQNREKSVDYLYQSEVADEWSIVFEGQSVTIRLSYGDILLKGISSDLMLHPKLIVEFDDTADTQYVYRVYSMFLRFIRLIKYDVSCGTFNVELFTNENGNKSYNGRLIDFATKNSKYVESGHEVEYSSYKPYIQCFLQFAANNPSYSFYHYPREGIRFFGRDYSSLDFLNIFAAFEAECHADKKKYEAADASRVQAIKKILIDQVEEYPKQELSKDEMDFLTEARNRIQQIGTQYGQKRKIINAYDILHNALDGSTKHIFYRPEFRIIGHLEDDRINELAKFLTERRGAIAHGNYSDVFTDVEAQKIRFLEILTYAQMLKRAGLSDQDIERVIGALFGCNYVLFQEKYH